MSASCRDSSIPRISNSEPDSNNHETGAACRSGFFVFVDCPLAQDCLSVPELANRLNTALNKARTELLNERTPQGHWEGRLSNSALSTATAVGALALIDHQINGGLSGAPEAIEKGLQWLDANRNADGGWGDTIKSKSNISTTTLVWAAFGMVKGADKRFPDPVGSAERWIHEAAGGETSEIICNAIIKRYGKDRTFSVPILTMLAISSRIGHGKTAWKHVIQLPFQLAALPQDWFATLRLPVVSYALPALIAIGLVKHTRSPSWNLLSRTLRTWATERTLKVLQRIQPENGGFLEATPLTSFVTMSLAASGRVGHPVVGLGAKFLLESMRPDGSWPIDTNLATWVTTLSVHALGPRSSWEEDSLSPLPWLIDQQYRVIHPYTNAPPGAWAWTDLPGGVPDADDTSGALLALKLLEESPSQKTCEAAEAGLTWLLNLQNGDGGIPTFCKGWTNLPFDKSSCDITAHTIRAWATWKNVPDMPDTLGKRIDRGLSNALIYLEKNQRGDGSWLPLWFGNQDSTEEENPTYGTSKVLMGLAAAEVNTKKMTKKGMQWLKETQFADGGWSGDGKGSPSIEETALAVEALATCLQRFPDQGKHFQESWRKGVNYLCSRIEGNEWKETAPIGFYFAKLWYFEDLYPLTFTVAALRASQELIPEVAPQD